MSFFFSRLSIAVRTLLIVVFKLFTAIVIGRISIVLCVAIISLSAGILLPTATPGAIFALGDASNSLISSSPPHAGIFVAIFSLAPSYDAIFGDASYDAIFGTPGDAICFSVYDFSMLSSSPHAGIFVAIFGDASYDAIFGTLGCSIRFSVASIAIPIPGAAIYYIARISTAVPEHFQ